MRLQLFKAGPKQENARGSCGPLQCISGSVSDEFPHCLRAFRGLAAPWSVAASPMPPRTNSSHSLSRFSVPNEARRSVSFDYARPQQSRPEKCVPAHVGDFLNAQDDRHLDVPRESLSGHDPPLIAYNAHFASQAGDANILVAAERLVQFLGCCRVATQGGERGIGHKGCVAAL